MKMNEVVELDDGTVDLSINLHQDEWKIMMTLGVQTVLQKGFSFDGAMGEAQQVIGEMSAKLKELEAAKKPAPKKKAAVKKGASEK